jgi:hypothetical protein
MCDAISRGEEFLGHTTKQRRVLYLDCENPTSVLQKRIENMGLKMDPQSFRLWSDFQHPVPQIYAGHGKTLRQIVRNSYRETRKPMLLVLDHWNQFFKPGDSGLEPGEVNPMIRTLKRLCGAGATILIIAHPLRRNENRLYGWGEESMDVLLRWARKGEVMKLTTQRSRLGEDHGFSVIPTTEEGRETGFRFVKDRLIVLLREFIAKNGALGKWELATKAAESFRKRKIKKAGRDRILEALDKHEGKEWRKVQHPHNRQTYRILAEKKP